MFWWFVLCIPVAVGNYLTEFFEVWLGAELHWEGLLRDRVGPFLCSPEDIGGATA